MNSVFFRATFYVALALLFSAIFYGDIAFAASSAISLPNPFNVPITDVSYGYLSKIFGAVWGLPGSTTTMLGVVFRDFNYGIMAVVPLIITYTTVRVVIDTAYSGDAMGKKMSPLVIVRTLAGIGLLIPQIGGYTLLQAVTMWIVLQGIGVADFIWKDTLDYLRKGGVIYEGISNKDTVSSLKLNGDLVTGGDYIDGSKSNDNALNSYAGSVSFLRSQVCMKVLEDALNDERKSASEYTNAPVASGIDIGSASFKAAKNFANSMVHLSYGIDTTEKSITFPGKTSLPKGEGFDLKDFEGACGKYTWAWDANQGYPEAGSDAYQRDFNFNDTAYQNAKQSGIVSIVVSVESLAGSILRNNELASYDPTKYDKFADLNVRVRDATINSATNYQATISEIRTAKALHYQSRDESNGMDKKFFDDAYKKGWASAGEYYYSLTKMQKRKIDTIFYKIWTKNIDGLVEKGRNLRPAPMILTGPSGGPNDTLTLLYNTFDKHSLNIPYKWSSDNLRSRLNSILNWTNNVNDTEIQPYVKNMNDILDKSGAALDLSDNEQFKKFVDDIKNLKDVSSTTKSSESAQKILKDLESSVKAFNIFNIAQNIKSAISGVTYGLVGITSYTEEALGINENAIRNPLYKCTTKVLKSWVDIMTSSENIAAPVQKLSGFGSTILDSVSTCWQEIDSNLTQLFQTMLTLNVLGSAIHSALSLVVSVLGSGSGGVLMILKGVASLIYQVLSLVIDYMWKWVLFATLTTLPLAMGVTAILFTLGVTLYFYVPLIPYLLFTLGILSWLIFVIEAMTASAIVAFGLMDPRASGDEIWGRAEPAQMLWLGVFLRPATMLVGLFTGTVLAFVGLVIINTTFMGFLNTFEFTPDALSLKNFGIMIAYTLMMVTLVNKCYECIYTIPEQILTWIGVQARHSTDAELLRDVKQGLTQIAGETGSVAKGASERKGGSTEGIGPPRPKG